MFKVNEFLQMMKGSLHLVAQIWIFILVYYFVHPIWVELNHTNIQINYITQYQWLKYLLWPIVEKLRATLHIYRPKLWRWPFTTREKSNYYSPIEFFSSKPFTQAGMIPSVWSVSVIKIHLSFTSVSHNLI